MYRFFSIVSLLLLSMGCSSDSKKSKYEAANNAESSEKKKGDNVPDWMKGEGSKAANSEQSGSLSTEGAKNATSDKSSSTKNDENSSQDSSKKMAQADPDKSGTSSDKGATKTIQSSGEQTVLMAKLQEGVQKSENFFRANQSKQMSEEEVVKVREEYAVMVEEWLAVANKLIKMELLQKDRETVVQYKQFAHKRLVGFNRPEHEQMLYDFGATLKDDPSNEIQKIYEFIMLQKPYNEMLKGNEFDADSFYENFDRVVSYWRDDAAVFQTASLWVNQLYAKEERENYLKMLEITSKHFSQSANTQIMPHADILKDRLMLAKIGFDIAITDLIKRKDGASERLMDAAKRVLAQPNPSSFVLTNVTQAGLQLEVANDYERAKKYFEQIGEAIKSYSNQTLKDSVQRLVDNALVRYNLLGKPLKVEGVIPKIENQSFVRKPIDFASYRGKVVIIFFWSYQNQSAYALLNDLDKFYNANEGKDIELIGINADHDTNMIRRVMAFEIGTAKRKWTHLMPTTPTVVGLATPMAKRCGVDSMPFNLLIDKEGKVDSFRVYGTKMEDAVSRLLGEEVNRIFVDPTKAAAKDPEKTKQGDPKSVSKEAPKKEAPKKEAPKKEAPKKEAPKKEASATQADQLKTKAEKSSEKDKK